MKKVHNTRDRVKNTQLVSIDLFSGIGGISLALQDICKPCLYCDISKDSIKVLESNIQKGFLHDAPIIADVRNVSKALQLSNKEVDIIVGGFPCQGFSNVGNKQGLEHEQSGLYREVIRIVDDFKPKAVFLENVPGVLSNIFCIIQNDFISRGYTLTWTIVPASHVGALHERPRWFCLAFDKHFNLDFNNLSYIPYDWSVEPNRTCKPVDKAKNNVRMRLLGNAVVPDAVRFAFFALCTAYQNTNISSPILKFRAHDLSTFLETHGNYLTNKQTRTTCKQYKNSELLIESHGISTPHTNFSVFPLLRAVNTHKRLKMKRPTLPLVLEPKHNLDSIETTKIPTKNLIYKRVFVSRWNTPRYGCIHACRCLTKRGLRDLPNQIRFEVNTKDRYDPVNAVFIEYLMGYPKDWTLTK